VRPETGADRVAVRQVNERAFGRTDEANLVDALRRQVSPFVSLVAVRDAAIVGHICFTPVTFEGDPSFAGVGLAPMAVLPEYQRGGVGSELVRAGVAACRALGRGAIVVLGHTGYYPRFGFQPASRWHLTCDYPVPDDAFMALELEPDVLSARAGRVHYHAAFSAVAAHD
jgi:putative acetyltransferase